MKVSVLSWYSFLSSIVSLHICGPKSLLAFECSRFFALKIIVYLLIRFRSVTLSQLCLYLQMDDLEQDNSGSGTAIENETTIVAKDGKYFILSCNFHSTIETDKWACTAIKDIVLFSSAQASEIWVSRKCRSVQKFNISKYGSKVKNCLCIMPY